MFGIDISEYTLKAELSKCFDGLACVYFAHHKPSKNYVAVKKYKMDSAREEWPLICKEIVTLRHFNHPNIIAFHTVFVNNFEINIVFPLFCFGSASDSMKNYFVTGFPELLCALILKDVLSGLEYLHKKGYVHRSIRASHILLNQTKAVLSGFRETSAFLTHGERIRNLHELPPNPSKGLNWLAPEVLEQNLIGYTEKSDIYSIGITTCELANALPPFTGLPTTLMMTEKIRGNKPTLLDYSTCPSEEMIAQAIEQGMGDTYAAVQTRTVYCQRQLSDHFHKFAEVCLERHPDERPTIPQLLNHHFFKQCKHTNLQEQFLNTMEQVDLDKINDESIDLCEDLNEMSIDNNFEWDF